MASTYELINSVEVGSGGTTAINFTSIPQTFTDLLIKVSARMSTADWKSYYNGNTSNYNVTFLYGDGSSSASYRSTVFGYIGLTNRTSDTSNVFGNADIYIANYATSQYKQIEQFGVSENDATGAYINVTGQFWNDTSPITSITLTQYTGGTISQYTTAYLYGISNA